MSLLDTQRTARHRQRQVCATMLAALGLLVATAQSAIADSPPAAPSNLEITDIRSERVDLVFVDRSTNERQFIIERKRLLSGAAWEVDHALADHRAGQPQATGWRERTSGRINSSASRWCFRIRAVNDAGSNVSAEQCMPDPDPDPTTVPLTLRRQPILEGFIPYLGEMRLREGRLLQMRVPPLPNGFEAVLFVKPGRNTGECDNPSAVVSVGEEQTTTRAQMTQIFGVAEPRFDVDEPLFVVACVANTGPVVNSIQLQATVRFE